MVTNHRGFYVLKSMWYLLQTYPQRTLSKYRKSVYTRDRMTNFWVTKSALQKKMFFFFLLWYNFLSSYQSTGLRVAFQPFTKMVLKKCVAATATNNALDSSSKRDKGFVIVCVTFTHTQYATVHLPLEHQGSINLFLLTKHTQARAEQHRRA